MRRRDDSYNRDIEWLTSSPHIVTFYIFQFCTLLALVGYEAMFIMNYKAIEVENLIYQRLILCSFVRLFCCVAQIGSVLGSGSIRFVVAFSIMLSILFAMTINRESSIITEICKDNKDMKLCSKTIIELTLFIFSSLSSIIITIPIMFVVIRMIVEIQL